MCQQKTSCVDSIGASVTFGSLYKDLVDRWHLFYSSGEQTQEVAVGEGVQFTVKNEECFELFMQDIDNGGTQ